MVGVANKPSRSSFDQLSIHGLGVIEKTNIEFGPGFNVLTGETGAGKTMVLTALSLLLGGKSDSQLVRQGHDRLTVSGRFYPGDDQNLIEMLSTLDLIAEDEMIFSRSVSNEGKSRATLSGVPSTAAILEKVGALLIEIHGQHANLQIAKPIKQRELLDQSGGAPLQQALNRYKNLYTSYVEKKANYEKLKRSLADKEREIARLSELIREFTDLAPVYGELESLDGAISKLDSIEELRLASSGASSALDHEESGALVALNFAKKSLYSARGKDAELDLILDQVNEALLTLADVNSLLLRYLSQLDSDPGALEKAQFRRAQLISFSKKYGRHEDRWEAFHEAIELGERAKNEIENLSGGEERLEELGDQIKSDRELLIDSAHQLSQERVSRSAQLGDAVTAELKELAMPSAQFVIQVNSPEIISESMLTAHGVDEVVMLFSSNPGVEVMPIAKVASGGELSRLMLAIEVVLADTRPVGTYIFDEIDAGIGGRAALEVGKRLRKLSQSAQVLVVTHLPQVAAFADHHFLVTKDSSDSITESSVTALAGEEREREIARMLSGLEGSEHAQEHARELLDLRN
jgi:DNA repair protein RecN (Recombination protein N)